MIIKYLRVSTTKQQILRQDLLMNKIGVVFDKEYIDKVSGKNADRPKLKEMLKDVKKGDVIYCESISRLGRNVDDLRAICKQLGEIGVTVNFVKEGFNTGGSTYVFLLTILGAVGEMEREMTKERVTQRVSQLVEEKNKTGNIGTKSGNWFGRQEKTVESLPRNFSKCYNQVKDKQITKVEMSKLLQCSRATLYRWIKLYEENNN